MVSLNLPIPKKLILKMIKIFRYDGLIIHLGDMFYKLVDQSSLIGQTNVHYIDTKKVLFSVLRNHLSKLFEGKDEDSIRLWASITMYEIEDDYICFTSCIDTHCPIYDVEVKKADESNIRVIPYKVDGYTEFTINDLKRTYPDKYYQQKLSEFEMISPLEVLGLGDCIKELFEGKIWVRTGFTGWNIIETKVDREALIEEEDNETDEGTGEEIEEINVNI